jgi:hypothetical protein
MPKNNSYILLVDWSNGSTEYIESRTKDMHTKRLNALRQTADVEYIRVLENPKQSYMWSNPNCSPEESWI